MQKFIFFKTSEEFEEWQAKKKKEGKSISIYASSPVVSEVLHKNSDRTADGLIGWVDKWDEYKYYIYVSYFET